MHDGTARSKVKIKVTYWHVALKVTKFFHFQISLSPAIFSGSWQMTTDSLTRGQYLNLFRPDF